MKGVGEVVMFWLWLDIARDEQHKNKKRDEGICLGGQQTRYWVRVR